MEQCNIISSKDGQTVIGTCSYDRLKSKIGNIHMNPVKEGHEVMDLNVNIYDNNEVFRCGDYLRFKYHRGFRGAGPAHIYEIELSRLDTVIKVHQWIIHLLGKNWITREMLHRMIAICEVHFGYDLHRFVEAA